MNLWLLLVVMALAVYRGTRLVTEDTFPPVLWLRDRLAGGYREPTRAEVWHANFPTGELEPGAHRVVPRLPGVWTVLDGEIQVHISPWKRSPHWLAELITCPWCCSGWVAAGVTAGTWATVGLPVPVLVWGAVWAAGGLIAGQDWA